MNWLDARRKDGAVIHMHKDNCKFIILVFVEHTLIDIATPGCHFSLVAACRIMGLTTVISSLDDKNPIRRLSSNPCLAILKIIFVNLVIIPDNPIVTLDNLLIILDTPSLTQQNNLELSRIMILD